MMKLALDPARNVSHQPRPGAEIQQTPAHACPPAGAAAGLQKP